MIRYCRLFVALLLVAATASPAAAGGLLVARFGGEDGHAASAHPSAIYYNPAGLALRSGTRIAVEGFFFHRGVEYDRPVGAIDDVLEPGETGSGTPADAVDANAGTAELSNIGASPFAAIASDLGVPNLGVGLALFVPFGGAAEWGGNAAYEGSDAYPGAADGVQRWGSIDSVFRFLYVSGAAAYRLPAARLSFGVSLSLVKAELQTLRARNATGTDDVATDTGSIVEGRSLVDVSQTTFALGAGVTWQPTDSLTLGVSYQSQPALGEMSMEGTLDNKFGTGDATQTPIDLRQEFPDVWRLAASWHASADLELHGSFSFQRWSVFENQCILDGSDAQRKCALSPSGGTAPAGRGVIVNIARDWSDGFAVGAGGSWQARGDLALYAGVGFDRGVIPDDTLEPSIVDSDKVAITLGARYWVPGTGASVVVHLLHVAYADADVAPRTRDAMDRGVTFDPPTRAPDGAGAYTQAVSAFNLGLEYAF